MNKYLAGCWLEWSAKYWPSFSSSYAASAISRLVTLSLILFKANFQYSQAEYQRGLQSPFFLRTERGLHSKMRCHISINTFITLEGIPSPGDTNMCWSNIDTCQIPGCYEWIFSIPLWLSCEIYYLQQEYKE